MKFFECSITPNNKIKIEFLGIKIKISKGKNRFDVLKRIFFILFSKFLAFKNKKLKIKKYDLIIPLGKNCELATVYKYYLNSFIDSSLFNWASYRDKNKFVETIIDSSKIFSQQVDFIFDQNMWYCNETTIVFHGNALPEELMDQNGNVDNDKKEREFNAVKSKIKYLAQKNIECYKSPKKKLYIFTFNIGHSTDDINYLERLYEYFNSQNKQFDMVVIIEETKYDDVLKEFENKHTNLFFRTIPYFREINFNAVCYSFDYYKAWASIFREFQYLKKRKKSNKKLKCDN